MALFGKTTKPEDAGVSDGRELALLKTRLSNANLPDTVFSVSAKELERLEKMDSSIPEYMVGLNYLEYILALPWNQYTEDNLDLQRAEKILEAQHYGLKQVKERILEFLAVRTLRSMADFRVLVVDDEPIARTNLEHVLKKEGYLVSVAANGLEALEQLKNQDFELVLTDLKMEKMDGIQLLEAARQVAPHSEFIIITGYATVGTAVDALKKGATNYLPKPVDLDELRSTVRQTRDRKKQLQMQRSPVLCFTGPPGTGKTSIGRAIAEALERKFIRISVAGLRDEAEMHGHRRTYVGAMPGRVINEIKRAGVRNPVFMLDEVDKIGQDFRGDPAAVLLEILDPEQNKSFTDHYLDLPFDISAVMFIATANAVEKLSEPLLDRLEIIPFHGYTEKEKEIIARKYIIPKQLREHGLAALGVDFKPAAITRMIRDYTQESGLRNLEREIASICRKFARICLQGGEIRPKESITIDEALVFRLLGPRKFTRQRIDTENRVGVATGVVWTEFGGEIIFVEVAKMKGGQRLILTGSLGEILRESAQTALSYLRSRAACFGIDPNFFEDTDIHIHIPAGAIPKDGPSAGLTIAMALVSLLTDRPVRCDVALTGELTLSGRILSISGLREKVLAAQRAGIRTVAVPKSNALDVESLDPDLKAGIDIILAESLEGLMDITLLQRVEEGGASGASRCN